MGALQRELDRQGLEILENQRESIASRKQLADLTRGAMRIVIVMRVGEAHAPDTASGFDAALTALRDRLGRLQKGRRRGAPCRHEELAQGYNLARQGLSPGPFPNRAPNRRSWIAQRRQRWQPARAVRSVSNRD